MRKVVFVVNNIICEGVVEGGLIYTRSKIYKLDDPKINILKSE